MPPTDLRPREYVLSVTLPDIVAAGWMLFVADYQDPPGATYVTAHNGSTRKAFSSKSDSLEDCVAEIAMQIHQDSPFLGVLQLLAIESMRADPTGQRWVRDPDQD